MSVERRQIMKALGAEIVLTPREKGMPGAIEKAQELLKEKHKSANHETLSDREFDVFKLIASGESLTSIAEKLSLSITTVSTYRSRILQKLKMKTNAELTRYAIENQLI